MSHARRLAAQAFIVSALGVGSLARGSTLEARASSCISEPFCGDIEECDLSLCFNCGPGISTQCDLNLSCPGQFLIYCGFNS